MNNSPLVTVTFEGISHEVPEGISVASALLGHMRAQEPPLPYGRLL